MSSIAGLVSDTKCQYKRFALVECPLQLLQIWCVGALVYFNPIFMVFVRNKDFHERRMGALWLWRCLFHLHPVLSVLPCTCLQCMFGIWIICVEDKVVSFRLDKRKLSLFFFFFFTYFLFCFLFYFWVGEKSRYVEMAVVCKNSKFVLCDLVRTNVFTYSILYLLYWFNSQYQFCWVDLIHVFTLIFDKN